jgi:adenosylcobinamide-phosphate synthase
MTPDALTILLLAALLDAAMGDPVWLYRALPHPVAAIGQAIAWADRRFNAAAAVPGIRRRNGVLLLAALIAASLVVGWIAHALLARISFGWILEVALMSTLLAQHSLYRHVRVVARALEQGGIVAARSAVGRIVGRDPNALDEAGVGRAALESLAENFSDGVTAPLFWGALLGLPGLLAYKAVNTADSMIGHLTARHRDFGWASARCDDLLNFVPARLSGIVLSIAGAGLNGGGFREGVAAMRRDAPRHRSPNAGWPESALASALGVALAGPRAYDGHVVADGWMNEAGRRDVTSADIRGGLRLYLLACALQLAVLALFAWVF